MPKARCEESYAAEKMYMNGMDLVEIASQLNKPEGTVRSWKNRYKWEENTVPVEPTATLRKNNCNVAKKRKRKKGGQPGNKNATGPPGNQNARKHGLFSKYLPADTQEIIENMPLDPLDMLWDQIQLAYAAIIRSQQIMHVEDKKDKTVVKVGEKHGNVSGKEWEVQLAWDKQANFLKAQSRAQAELRNLIKQYEEMLHKNWKLATAEQKARIKHIKAQTLKISGDDPGEIQDDGFLDALNGTAAEDWADED